MNVVSVVVPCYNYGWLLAETLDSLLAQEYSHWECIIVDDGSTDNTRIVAERYQARDLRFRYVYQANGGMSAARNHGLRLAQGEYIQFLDADDLLASGKFAIQVAYLEAHPDADIVYGDVRYFHHQKPDVFSRSFDMTDTPWMSVVPETGAELVQALVRGNIMVINASLIRKSFIRKVGLFNAALRSMEDWEYWLRCAIAGARMHHNDNPNAWSLVRIHPTSTSQDTARMCRYEVIVRCRLRGLLRKEGNEEAIKINEAGIDTSVKSIAYYARLKTIGRDSWKGIRYYYFLAQTTKQYSYYLRNVLYLLRNKINPFVDNNNI